jgi:hypothetical protein
MSILGVICLGTVWKKSRPQKRNSYAGYNGGNFFLALRLVHGGRFSLGFLDGSHKDWKEAK